MRVTGRYDHDPLSPEVWKDVIRVNEYIKGGLGYVEEAGTAPARPGSIPMAVINRGVFFAALFAA